MLTVYNAIEDQRDTEDLGAIQVRPQLRPIQVRPQLHTIAVNGGG